MYVGEKRQMSILEELKSMPRSLVGMFLVFLLVPVTSLAFHDLPWRMYDMFGGWPTFVVGLTYWVCPWLLCFAVLFRRFLFMPFYFLQCFALVLHSLVFGASLTFELQLIRYALVGWMFYIGFLFVNKDLFYPFMAKSRRFWRRARRFNVKVEVGIARSGNGERKIVGVVQNCSATGMGVRMDKSRCEGLLDNSKRGDHFRLFIDFEGLCFDMPADLMWLFDYGEFWSLGLQTLDSKMMIEFLTAALGKERRVSGGNWSQLQLLEQGVGQGAYILWMIFIGLSFGLPAFAGLL